MAGRMLVIAILGLVGVTVPFIFANKIIEAFYAPAVTGSAPPIYASVAGFGVASLISALAFYITVMATKRQRDTSVTAEGIDEPDELPE